MLILWQRLKSAGEILLIPTDKILPNPNQPRRAYDYGKLEALADSIRANGLLQPINIRLNQEGMYELVTGERRLKASRIAGLREVPCVLMDIDDGQSAVFALLENIQRADLNFFEEAQAIERLKTIYGYTQEQLARQLGRTQAALSNKIRLLRLSDDIRQKILINSLSERHARALLRLPDEGLRQTALDKIIARQLNVSDTEQLISHLLEGEEKQAAPPLKREPLRLLIKDVSIFVNTLDHAVDTMRKAGIRAAKEKCETEDYIEYKVRIPKGAKAHLEEKNICI